MLKPQKTAHAFPELVVFIINSSLQRIFNEVQKFNVSHILQELSNISHGGKCFKSGSIASFYIYRLELVLMTQKYISIQWSLYNFFPGGYSKWYLFNGKNSRCMKEVCECDREVVQCYKKYNSKFRNQYKGHDQSKC